MLTDPTVTMRHIDTPLTPRCECGLLRDFGFVSVEMKHPEDMRYQVLITKK